MLRGPGADCRPSRKRITTVRQARTIPRRTYFTHLYAASNNSIRSSFARELETQLRRLVLGQPARHPRENDAVIALRAPVQRRGVARRSCDGEDFDELGADLVGIDDLLPRSFGKHIELASHAVGMTRLIDYGNLWITWNRGKDSKAPSTGG